MNKRERWFFNQWHRRLERQKCEYCQRASNLWPSGYLSRCSNNKQQETEGAKATKLGSCHKHPAYCLDWNSAMCLCTTIGRWKWILSLLNTRQRCLFPVIDTGGSEEKNLSTSNRSRTYDLSSALYQSIWCSTTKLYHWELWPLS